MKSLKEIYEQYTGPDGWGDKGTAHMYIDEYETLLKDYRNKSVVLENGIYIIEDVANLDNVRHQFESLDNSKIISIIDNRNIKGRYDDVLVVIKNK